MLNWRGPEIEYIGAETLSTEPFVLLESTLPGGSSVRLAFFFMLQELFKVFTLYPRRESIGKNSYRLRNCEIAGGPVKINLNVSDLLVSYYLAFILNAIYSYRPTKTTVKSKSKKSKI